MASTAPHITVATVIEREQRFLMVEEHIGDLGTALVLNQPAGHLESGESLLEAALRETLEETAWRCEITGLLGIYQYQPRSLPYSFLRVAFTADALEDTGAALDQGIERAVWLSEAELAQQAGRHRSPMVQQCISDYRRGQRLPLDLLKVLPPGP